MREHYEICNEKIAIPLWHMTFSYGYDTELMQESWKSGPAPKVLNRWLGFQLKKEKLKGA